MLEYAQERTRDMILSMVKKIMSRWQKNENWKIFVGAQQAERTGKIPPAVINYPAVVLVETYEEAYELYRHFNAISKHLDRVVVDYSLFHDDSLECYMLKIEIKNARTLDMQIIRAYIRDAMGERKEVK